MLEAVSRPEVRLRGLKCNTEYIVLALLKKLPYRSAFPFMLQGDNFWKIQRTYPWQVVDMTVFFLNEKFIQCPLVKLLTASSCRGVGLMVRSKCGGVLATQPAALASHTNRRKDWHLLFLPPEFCKGTNLFDHLDPLSMSTRLQSNALTPSSSCSSATKIDLFASPFGGLTRSCNANSRTSLEDFHGPTNAIPHQERECFSKRLFAAFCSGTLETSTPRPRPLRYGFFSD